MMFNALPGNRHREAHLWRWFFLSGGLGIVVAIVLAILIEAMCSFVFYALAAWATLKLLTLWKKHRNQLDDHHFPRP
jgi:Flp pilus assembly protein TadB